MVIQLLRGGASQFMVREVTAQSEGDECGPVSSHHPFSPDAFRDPIFSEFVTRCSHPSHTLFSLSYNFFLDEVLSIRNGFRIDELAGKGLAPSTLTDHDLLTVRPPSAFGMYVTTAQTDCDG